MSDTVRTDAPGRRPPVRRGRRTPAGPFPFTRFPTSPRFSRRAFLGGALAAASTPLLAACGSTGAVPAGKREVTVWGGFESTNAELVAHFNDTHRDIHITWVDNGWGAGEFYPKLQTTLHAEAGPPDVFLIDRTLIPNLVVRGYLLDLAPFGAAGDAAHYAEPAWERCGAGEEVYGIPVDSGPLVLFHREDLFAGHGIEVPATWDDYAAAAERVKAADRSAFIGTLGPSELLTTLVSQAGGRFFRYDMSEPTRLGLSFDTPEARRVIDFWGGLVRAGLVDTTPYFSTEMDVNLRRGVYWACLAPSWYSWQIESKLVDQAGRWRVRGAPQWDPGRPASGNWGGSAYVATRFARDPEAAAVVCREIFGADQTAWDMALWTARLFPDRLEQARSDAFAGRPADFFGGQRVNEVYIESSEQVLASDHSPFERFVTDTFDVALHDAVAGRVPWPDLLAVVGERVAAYAREQAFDVQ
ncbi:ABC transporter substrate-binding protein [Streptomyces marincola]|uniref:ABC transporter substrate-binding protein n=1 Tax=Streptomyces marincola TaxID=2878388 RepID=UPI001CF44507|nr:extracellular solute-binding protein [Streptomyces marincola]UCM88180.1 extracellular solute-binding protein [Streptomyces marincola]